MQSRMRLAAGLRPPFSRFEGAGKEISLGVRPILVVFSNGHKVKLIRGDRVRPATTQDIDGRYQGPSEFAPVPYRGVVLRVSRLPHLGARGSPATPPTPLAARTSPPLSTFSHPCSIVTTLSGFVKGAICH
ncbi:hypothetical protein PAPYR_13387 [Paratrimastix pyriformis]|uniref:Uncharacterized protein n=1 Tax=Paratrimastix pyriformis TaxID=342808 RepID=A0ABQ8U589_9EUKA|nr:hypothetical protein PAPYR_13387 [Paratrimastix pyriformis]